MKKVKAPWTKETFEILPRERIEEIINDLDPREVVEKAYAGYIPNFKTGYAALDLVTGELYTQSLGQGEENMGRDALWVSLFDINQNGVDLDIKDIFTPEEIENYKKSRAYDEGADIKEYLGISDEEYKERIIDALEYYFQLEPTCQESIVNQLDRWYEGE